MLIFVKGLFSWCFVRLHICDGNWARLTSVHCVHSIHCFWRVC